MSNPPRYNGGMKDALYALFGWAVMPAVTGGEPWRGALQKGSKQVCKAEAGLSVLLPFGVRGAVLQPCLRHSGNVAMVPGTEVPGYSRAVPSGLSDRVFAQGHYGGACARPRCGREAAMRIGRLDFRGRWARLGSLRTATMGTGTSALRCNGKAGARAFAPVSTDGHLRDGRGRAEWEAGVGKRPATSRHDPGVFYFFVLAHGCLRTASMRSGTSALRCKGEAGARAFAHGSLRTHTAAYGCIRLGREKVFAGQGRGKGLMVAIVLEAIKNPNILWI
ncbi:MAG: hypothetical protein JWR26_4185 [Pedosphaera sp.]|nr:hypothetical protein [Pedosphaera sp.]